jgi:hypothetical protein
MRKKKEKHEEPTYAKATNKNTRNKSTTQHSILQKHETRLEEFKKKNERIASLDLKNKGITKEIDKLEKEVSFMKLNQEYYGEVYSKLEKLQQEHSENERARKNISSGDDLIQYLLESSHMIMTYVNLEEQEGKLLMGSEHSEIEADQLNKLSSEKKDIVDEYLGKFQKNYVSTRHMFDKYASTCTTCNETYAIEHGFLVCPNCGSCKPTVEISGELSFKEMQDYDYRPQFTYDKMTHLEDWLRRFQAKENRVIPQEVLDKVILEAQKERVKDLTTLTEDKVKRYLKKLGLNEYYDNVIGIINRINGRPPFTLTVEIEDKIKTMFQQIQEPFEKHKPKNRKNFLSYSYTLHKMFQIIGLHEFSRYFPLLKSADKLRQQDETFKKVVAEMASKDKTVNWVFYPSI